ncbi:hypothetical protein AVEN_164679-1 [Araneus ventricosus]|uniref:Uncharacterized protein n=1 Tax=Araneus ventricosus TaxID=182803 RepID=A0A4Y2M6W6_ARAVE|nr:hypothetical protein AVEN_164679-1 [Araneus ventricosus]
MPQDNVTDLLGCGIHVAKFCILRQRIIGHCLYKRSSINVALSVDHNGFDRVTEAAKMAAYKILDKFRYEEIAKSMSSGRFIPMHRLVLPSTT